MRRFAGASTGRREKRKSRLSLLGQMTTKNGYTFNVGPTRVFMRDIIKDIFVAGQFLRRTLGAPGKARR